MFLGRFTGLYNWSFGESNCVVSGGENVILGIDLELGTQVFLVGSPAIKNPPPLSGGSAYVFAILVG